MSTNDDDALLDAWQRGDAVAFDELTRRHYTSIRRFFDLRVPAAADDLTQQTFLGALEAVSRFRRESSFRTFLFGIAHKQLLRTLRDQRPRVERFGSEESRTSLSVVAVRQQEHQLLLMALAQLPLELQLVTELYYWENLRTAEIGEALSLNPSTVASRLARARELLGEHITQMTRPGPLRDRLLGDLEQFSRALGPVTAAANARAARDLT
ncbi:MAG: sigma-70 family RNA polymerase sigma factor [Nannocystaceae bacterium]|jgi:RNA polymerase sigma factor (sigma-70 family)|nr:sigma-70 family RNA polymerase sigma factor [Deltaproteobacteria bacterium]MBK8714058.1 sigma-70 family RNA polymerase sigma factor [Deltaproteobacteria bacterium]MBP7285690.1 sigma-70 family RNA polymerase sigma factor [Nannocystaceae bacterium]